jgi:hypothetical protein
LNFLDGLVDSDGYYNNSGYYFTMSINYEKLTDDMVYLGRSLGFASYKTYVTNGTNGPVKCPYASFSINGEGVHEIPCILNRKMAIPRKSPKNVSVTGIDDIEILENRKYYGFEFDSYWVISLLHITA